MTQPNATQDFLKDETQWSGASLELHDVQGLWGGQIIRVNGSWRVVVQIIPSARPERRYEFELDPADWQHLIQVVIENDFVTIKPIERPGLPDESRPRITLVNAMGDQCMVAKWAGVEDKRFDAVYAALMRLKTFVGA